MEQENGLMDATPDRTGQNCSKCQVLETKVQNVEQDLKTLRQELTEQITSAEKLALYDPHPLLTIVLSNLSKILERRNGQQQVSQSEQVDKCETPPLSISKLKETEVANKNKRKRDAENEEPNEKQSSSQSFNSAQTGNSKQIYQPDILINRNLMKVKIETDYNPIVAIKEEHNHETNLVHSVGTSTILEKTTTKSGSDNHSSDTSKNSTPEETDRLADIRDILLPSEWLSDVDPKRTPYFPQLGDDLVYLRQGHQLYIHEVEKSEIYPYTTQMKKQLPYVIQPDLPAELSVRVVKIKFEIMPPRVVQLTLARTDWNSKESIGSHISVQYHDVVDVDDFLVLRQMYDKSLNYPWSVRDGFRCLLDTTWHLGTVVGKKALHSDFPDSNFLSYQIEWIDNKKCEKLSPWDMEMIPHDLEIPYEGKYGIPASEEDKRNFMYKPFSTEWIHFGSQDKDCQRISNLVEKLMQLTIAEPFLTPVNLEMYPDYAFVIAYPIDLTTIKKRLENRYYRRTNAIFLDIKHISINAKQFNQPDTTIVKYSEIITHLLIAIVENINFSVKDFYQKIPSEYHHGLEIEEPSNNVDVITLSSGSEPELEPPSTSTIAMNESKQKKTSPQKKRIKLTRVRGEVDNVDSWQNKCLNLLKNIWDKPEGEPFRYPISLVDYPDYSRVIATPISLNLIKEDLMGDNYKSPMEFHQDMLLIFQNAKKYNDPNSWIGEYTNILERFYEENSRQILQDFRCNPAQVGKRKSKERSPLKKK